MTQAGHTLRLRQPRIQGPSLNAGGEHWQAALPQARPARSPPPRLPSVRPPPHAAPSRRGDLEGKECFPIGLRPRPSGLCADSAGMPLPRTGGPTLGSALIHAEHCPPFDAASEQQTGQHSGINESRAADSKPHGQCWLRGLVRPTVVFAHRIAAAFAARASPPHGAGKQRAAIAGTRSTESRAHACHRSSHRVESLVVSLRQHAKTSPLCSDEHIAAIATPRQRTFKF